MNNQNNFGNNQGYNQNYNNQGGYQMPGGYNQPPVNYGPHGYNQPPYGNYPPAYNQGYAPMTPPVSPAEKKGKALAKTSQVLGIISAALNFIALFLYAYFNLAAGLWFGIMAVATVPAIVAVILSVCSKKTLGKMTQEAKTGMISGLIAIGALVLWALYSLIVDVVVNYLFSAGHITSTAEANKLADLLEKIIDIIFLIV